MDDAAKPDLDLLRRRRFRFGLKTLFIAVTVLCIWLGYRYVRERRTNEILARHEAVLATLTKQIATPFQTLYAISPGGEDELLRRFGHDSKRFRRATLLRVDHSSPGQSSALDVSKLLASGTNPTTIADRLAQHYGSALVPAGFEHTYTHGGSRSDLGSVSGTYRGIWTSPAGDLNVIIDAEVFAQSKTATVSILFTDSQQIRIW
jgi:hypothetical protein